MRGQSPALSLSLSLPLSVASRFSLLVCICRLVSIRELTYGSYEQPGPGCYNSIIVIVYVRGGRMEEGVS